MQNAKMNKKFLILLLFLGIFATAANGAECKTSDGVCCMVKEKLGGTCSSNNDNSFTLKLNSGLNYNGYSFDDENTKAGKLGPRNACLLAYYGNEGSYIEKPNTNTYAVSGGPQMKHFNHCCCANCPQRSQGKKCMQNDWADGGFDFMNFMIGDACDRTTDTDASYTELHCTFDVDLRSTESTPAPSTSNNEVIELASGVGGWGGSCTCPDGEVYQVGDYQDFCGSLACEGGTSGRCNRHVGSWLGRKVICATQTPVVNPCNTNNGGCDENASCTNNAGTAVCNCNDGFNGDGRSCTQKDDRDCEAYREGDLTSVTNNNLGGQGPDYGDPQILEYSNFLVNNGQTLKLVVTTNADVYENDDSSRNGKSRDFGRIVLRAGTGADFTWTLKNQDTNVAVAIPGIHISFYDIDQHYQGHTGIESVEICNANEVFTTKDSSFIEEQIPDRIGCKKFKSISEEFTSNNNPTSSHELTENQKHRSVTAILEHKSTFSTRFAATGNGGDRYFYFAFTGVLCENPCATGNGGCSANEICRNDNGNAVCEGTDPCYNNGGLGECSISQTCTNENGIAKCSSNPCSIDNGGCSTNQSCTDDNGVAKCGGLPLQSCSSSDTNPIKGTNCKCIKDSTTNDCFVNRYCWKDNTCNFFPFQSCSPSDTAVITGAPCQCADDSTTNDCAVNKYCWKDNTCNDFPFQSCSLSDTSAITGAPCQCADDSTTNDCAVDKFCWTDKTCNEFPLQNCSPSDTVAISNAPCKCIDGSTTNDCAINKYCWQDKTCNDSPPPTFHPTVVPTLIPTTFPTNVPTLIPTSQSCSNSDSVAITNKPCKCIDGSNKLDCSVNQYCWMDNTCNDISRCKASADVLTESCGYRSENDEEEIEICDVNKYFYDNLCQDSKPNVCIENYFYPTSKHCLCGTETKICGAGDGNEYCWEGECTVFAKCPPLNPDDAFYGGKVYGKWFASERKMGMSITTPRQVKITEIDWLRAKTKELKYIDTDSMTNIRDWRLYGHCYDCNTGDHSNPNSENYDSLVEKGWTFTGEKKNWMFNTNGYNDEKHKSTMSYKFKNMGTLKIEVQNKHSSDIIKIEKKALRDDNVSIETTVLVQPGSLETLTLIMENGKILSFESKAAYININSWNFIKHKEIRIDCSSFTEAKTCEHEKNWPKDYCKWNTKKNMCEKDFCKEAYVLDIEQTKYFGPGANYTIMGQQMKTNLKVKAFTNFHKSINTHDYFYTKKMVNVIPVLINLKVEKIVTCRFKIDTPTRPEEGQTEFILMTRAEENMAESGRKTVKIVMKIFSNTCVAHSDKSKGVSLTKGNGFLSTTDSNPNVFTWDRDANKKVKQSWEDEMCVESLTWEFVPAKYEDNEYKMTLTFTSADMPKHKWSADVDIDIKDADVLTDVGFGANMATYSDRKCKKPEDKFRLGQRFWAKIQLSNLAVNAEKITCETFIIKQTKDGKTDETDMKEVQYKFLQNTAEQDALNEHICGAELDSTHFHKSVEGYDTLLESNIKIEYVQGHTQTRRLLLNITPPKDMKNELEFMDEFSVGEMSSDMTDEMYKNSERKPDTGGLSLGLTLLDLDTSSAFETIPTVNTNFNKNAPYIMFVSFVCFGVMTMRMYSKHSKNKEGTYFKLLAEEDVE